MARSRKIDFFSDPVPPDGGPAADGGYDGGARDARSGAACDADGTAAPVPPIYFGGARLLAWAKSGRGGMTVEFGLRDVGPKEVNPFKGLRFGKENGQRFRVWCGPYSELIELEGLDEVSHVYAGESQLMFYGDTCTKGVTVKVMLDSGPDGAGREHPFDGMDEGRVEGADFITAFWAIDDDETLVPKKAVRSKTPFHQLSEVRQSNLVVGDREFVNFLHARLDRLIGVLRPAKGVDENPRVWATEVVRLYLGVDSRAVMNHETLEGVEARKRWKVLMSEYFQSDEFNERRHFAAR